MNFILAYVAGYTDGDGCFNLRKTTPKKAQCSFIISSTDKLILEFFRNLFGGTVRCVREATNQKAQYQFIKYGKCASNFIKQLYPLLIEKKEEAELFCLFNECGNFKEKILCIDDMKTFRLKGLAKPSDKPDLEAIRKTIDPAKEDFAYLAGFIDAECCIGLQRYKTLKNPNWIYKPILQCNNTRSQSLRWAISRFGGQIHFIDRSRYGANHRNQLTWRLSSRSLLDLIPKILPFIRHKKEVCEELIKFYQTCSSMSRNNHKFTETYKFILAERSKIFDKIHRFNRKGS